MARYLHACYSVPNQARIQVDKAHCIHGPVSSCVNSKLSGDIIIICNWYDTELEEQLISSAAVVGELYCQGREDLTSQVVAG